MPSDLVLCARIVSYFVKRIETFASISYVNKYFTNELEFQYDCDLSGSDISGEIVPHPRAFGVRCHSWRLRYENGFADDATNVQDFPARLYYEIELSKPSGYVFSVKHRETLIRLGFKPVSENVLKPWSRITTRIGVQYATYCPSTRLPYLEIIGIVPPQYLYSDIAIERNVSYPRKV